VISSDNQTTVTINVDSNTKYYQVPLGKVESDVKGIVTQDNNQAKKAGKTPSSVATDLRKAHVPANWRDNLGWLATFDSSTQFSRYPGRRQGYCQNY
jgi:hypothetical protein